MKKPMKKTKKKPEQEYAFGLFDMKKTKKAKPGVFQFDPEIELSPYESSVIYLARALYVNDHCIVPMDGCIRAAEDAAKATQVWLRGRRVK